jgi:hypothetical protein
MLYPATELKKEPGRNPVTTKVCYLHDAGFLLDILSDPEDGHDMFL